MGRYLLMTLLMLVPRVALAGGSIPFEARLRHDLEDLTQCATAARKRHVYIGDQLRDIETNCHLAELNFMRDCLAGYLPSKATKDAARSAAQADQAGLICGDGLRQTLDVVLDHGKDDLPPK